jgi:hypothetical protein
VNSVSHLRRESTSDQRRAWHQPFGNRGASRIGSGGPWDRGTLCPPEAEPEAAGPGAILVGLDGGAADVAAWTALPVVVARAEPYPCRMSTRPAEDLYEHDFFAWTQLQARELRRFARTRPNLPLDLGHLAMEVADLGKEQRTALRSWVVRIIEHLLLLEHAPAEAPRRGWIDEIVGFRDEIDARLTATLRRDLSRQLPRLHERARRRLARKLERYGETDNVPPVTERSPYTLDQVLGDWWPGREVSPRRMPR